jgi:enoyl-CoA hydratase/carnithine racemase
MDLKRWTESESPISQSEVENAIGMYSGVLESIFSARIPIVCLVEGEAKAGGVGLACACDIVVARERASFELGEVIFGLIPANVLPYLLSLRMAPQKARYLVMSSRRLSASEALGLNLVDEVVPEMEVERRVREIFSRLLHSSPRALAAAKEFTADLIGKTPAEGSVLARRRLLEMMRDPVTVQGVRALQEGSLPAWFSRFKPQWPLTLPRGVENKEGRP